MHALPTTRTTRPILWIAVLALLVAAIGSQLRMRTCVGECCELEAVASACCQLEAAIADDGCCGCCDEVDAARDGETDDGESGNQRGGCAPGCCLTMDFDVELAPIDVPVELPMAFALALPPLPFALAPAAAREFETLRPFDRGPPRVDRSTALRVCTVLLI